MPILLDDLDLTLIEPKKNGTDPKFFSSKLTGNGQKIGLLNESLLPVNTTTNTAYAAADHIERKSSHTQHDITTTTIPIAPITRRAMTQTGGSFTIPVPSVDQRFEIDLGTKNMAYANYEAFFDMTPQAATMYEDNSGDKMKRDFVVQYRMELYLVKTGNTPHERAVYRQGRLTNAGVNSDAQVVLAWDSSPLKNALDFIDGELAKIQLRCLNAAELDTWMQDTYSIYEAIAAQARIWDSEKIADEVCAYIDGLPAAPTGPQLNELALQLRYLENYNVPLDAYRAIHKKLAATFSDDIATSLSKQNLNLLMNHTLDKLEQLKPQLAVPAAPAAAPVLPAHLSKQQLAALTTHEPLVMTQAGAGTGKSTVILERIKYLEACGVPASDITVLSFTNAAADNITEKNPNVGSMTIAKKIIDIYALNHPGHQVSMIDTIINSIDIFYPNDQFAAEFRRMLLEVDKNSIGSFTALNTFIEYNFDQVIATLDRIGQTSLELQIIICYQRIDTMLEPPHVLSKYLIIDEVQDNSIFEFIYVLKYITKHQQSLFIVGDASQTLYEFRSANPRALNTLEGSGVFATYKLTTNYRSNQEILDFANVVLGDLETNQIAGIQLEANSMAVPTAASFQDKVTVHYEWMQKVSGFVSNDLPLLLKNVVFPQYVDDCLNRGEQVAFLAYSRREVDVVREALEQKYPGRHIANMVSDRIYATDIFSKYIKFFWNDVLQVQPANAAFTAHQGIMNNLDKLTKNAGNREVQKAVNRTISEWWVENKATIDAWVMLTQQGSLPLATFFERLRDNMLGFEIGRNQQKLNINKQRNQERKRKNLESKAELVISTIHGAKGLEFDNVVVLHKDDSRMGQDKKRMFYVAFTRAMKSMYVLSHGTLKNPPIQSQYEQIVNALTKRDARAAALAAGADPDLERELDLIDDATDEGSTDGSSVDEDTNAALTA